ncbi:hypothetical protein Godav_018224 [Gossypium davidsonii]|uniref:Uncharacterized protein n=1 Tax=Gossypium davidsonii TaxID=34287 RepID=A0A7J8QVZ6_GOSDV|nr:hypothetical protein [Gossypium davidsonii]
MGSEEAKDPLKGVDWKAIGSELQKDPSASNKPVIKKRLPKKIRQIPECYFFPQMSTPSTIAFYGAYIGGGIGAGMLLEVWINNKIKEDLKTLIEKIRLSGSRDFTASSSLRLSQPYLSYFLWRVTISLKVLVFLANNLKKLVVKSSMLAFRSPRAEANIELSLFNDVVGKCILRK